MKKKIFVIDDEPDTLELCNAVLSMKDFDVKTFISAKEALNALKEGNIPDLVILDIRMPEISGPDFCRIVREDEKLKNLKIVYFTASSEQDQHLIKESKVLGYIFKPFDNEDIVKQINKYIGM